MAFSGSQITRLGYYGASRQLNGAFSGKAVAPLGAGHRPIAPWLNKNRKIKKGTRV